MATFLRESFKHHVNEKAGTFLGPWFARHDRNRDHERVLAAAVLETGKSLPRSAPAGDERTLRGIPVIGALPGAIAGTRPETDVPNRLDRLRKRIEG